MGNTQWRPGREPFVHQGHVSDPMLSAIVIRGIAHNLQFNI